MDINSIKIGTIGQFHVRKKIFDTTLKTVVVSEHDITGVIISPLGAYDDYYLVDELGNLTGFNKSQLVSVSPAIISEEIHSKFVLVANKYEQIQKMRKKQEELENTILETQISLKDDMRDITHLAGFYSLKEFDKKIEALGYKRVTSRREGSLIKVLLKQTNEIKYSPHDLSFLQIDNGDYIVKEENDEYRQFLLNNAPKMNKHLAKLSNSVVQEIEIEDEHIYAVTKYLINFTNGGYAKKVVDTIVLAMTN